MNPIRLPRLITGVQRFDDWIDDVLIAIEKALNVTVSGAATLTNVAGRVHIHVPQVPAAIAKTTSTITARSGTTAGSGTIKLQMFSIVGTTPTYMDDPAALAETVYNFSGKTGGIASGKYIAVHKIDGYWHTWAEECT